MDVISFTEAERCGEAAVPSRPSGGLGIHMRIADLPKPVLCVPLVAHYLWLAARYRSLTLPSCLNPAIETGGIVGESKAACLDQIGTEFSPFVAAWCRVPPGHDARTLRRKYRFEYPLIAKPDIGWCGYGVRRVNNDAELAAYAAAFPAHGTFILQVLVTAPQEAGLFYIRAPGARCGGLESVTLRHTPHVVGDGVQPVKALVAAGASTRAHAKYYAESLSAAAAAHIPARGETVLLTTIASLRAGATYEDAPTCITPRLERQIDAIARSMPEFHLGRFDVRFASITELQAGLFTIIEVNGAGSEAIQFWDRRLPLVSAFLGVFGKQAKLFELGAGMRARGHAPVGFTAVARAWLRQMRLVRAYPASN